jgi:hypothetical protein
MGADSARNTSSVNFSHRYNSDTGLSPLFHPQASGCEHGCGFGSSWSFGDRDVAFMPQKMHAASFWPVVGHGVGGAVGVGNSSSDGNSSGDRNHSGSGDGGGIVGIGHHFWMICMTLSMCGLTTGMVRFQRILAFVLLLCG